MKGKTKQVLIRISERTDKELRNLIASKYGSYRRGLLSKEIEEALIYWIQLHKKSSVKVEVEGPEKDRELMVFYDVLKLLKRKYKFIPQEVTWKDLMLAISRVRGSDPRTVKKWLKRFIERGFIKEINPAGIYAIEKRPSSEEIEEEL